MTDSTPETPAVDHIQEFAKALRAPLPRFIEVITDLSGGRGQLVAGLADFTTTNCLITDSKPHTMVKLNRPAYQSMDVSRITGDISTVYPLLRETNWQGDLFIGAPSLYTKHDKTDLYTLVYSDCPTVNAFYTRFGPKEVESSVMTLLIALDRATERGEGVLITPDDIENSYRGLLKHVWLKLSLVGNPLKPSENGEWETGDSNYKVYYWAKSHLSGPQMHIEGVMSTTDLVNRLRLIPEVRQRLRMGVSIHFAKSGEQTSVARWEAVRQELLQRQKATRDDWNLWLDGSGVIKVAYSPFQQFSSEVPRDALAELITLLDKTPAELVIQHDSRERLLRAINCPLWRVEPSLAAVVNEALSGYNASRAPLYALPPAQRLAYIDEVRSLKCVKNWLRFEAGKSYPVSTFSALVERMKQKPNLQGDMEDILLNGSEMIIGVRDSVGHEVLFIDGRHMKPGVTVSRIGLVNGVIKPDYALQVLLDKFEIPAVDDVSVTLKETFDKNRETISNIQTFINRVIDPKFAFKKFQVEDIARAACHDGVVLAWDCGAGKTLAAVLYPLTTVGIDWPATHLKRGLVPLKPVLIVAPENIHEQISAELAARFGIKTVKLDSQATYLKLTDDGRKKLRPAFYLSSYTQMGLNKIAKIPVPSECSHDYSEVAKMMYAFGVSLDEVKATRLEQAPGDGMSDLMAKAIQVCQYRYSHYRQGVGETKNGIKCIFSPSLADLSGHEFECVCIDEGVRIKATDSIIGAAIRELDPPNRLVLTGTPVKNRLRDLFWLMHWAAGGKEQPHPRFPYSNDPGEQAHFASDFQVCERNLTKEAQKRKRSPYGSKTLPSQRKKKARGAPGIEVCNIHRLWKITAPLVLRRRKQDIGEEIVAKKKQIIRVPMGAKQYEVYRYHLLATYLDCNGSPCIGPKLQALRSAAAAPNSDLLQQLPPAQEGVGNGLYRSETDYTPKLAAALAILEQRMRAGEQTIVFSALHEPLDTLSKRLHEAGVPHDVLDGRTSPGQRGKAAAHFQKGLAGGGKPIMLAGVKAMGEGLSFHLANNVICLSFDWALDAYEQSINRCHRLNSVKDVNVYPIICVGSIDRKLESMLDEKGDTAELVIDGKLIGEETEEVNLRELLTIAESEFRSAESYPEEKLEREWPGLKARLASAWARCRSGNTVETTTEQETEQLSWKVPEPVSLPRLLERIRQMKEREGVVAA